MEKNLLRIRDVALLYEVSVQTVYRWISKYEIETVIIEGTKHIDLEELKKYEKLAQDKNSVDYSTGAGAGALTVEDDTYSVVDEEEPETKANIDLKTKYELLLQECEHLKELNSTLEEYKKDLQSQNGYLIADNIRLQKEIKMLEEPKQEQKETLFEKIKNYFNKN